MADVYRTVVRGTARIIKRAEKNGRRVVYGEVMIPAPRLRKGDRVKVEDLAGRIHYDGGFMVREEIVKLVDVFAAKRPDVDIEHDGTPIAATVAESFIAGGPTGEAWAPWTTGAWVVGVQIHDEETWERIEEGELVGFSIQFIVKQRKVPVLVDFPDGKSKKVVLVEFYNARPQFLSLVSDPATGQGWKLLDRAVQRLPAARIVERDGWDAGAALDRVKAWAGDDGDRLRRAHAWYDEARHEGALIADVEEGELVIVRSAVAAVVDQADELEDVEVSRLAGQLQRVGLAIPDDDRACSVTNTDREDLTMPKRRRPMLEKLRKASGLPTSDDIEDTLDLTTYTLAWRTGEMVLVGPSEDVVPLKTNDDGQLFAAPEDGERIAIQIEDGKVVIESSGAETSDDGDTDDAASEAGAAETDGASDDGEANDNGEANSAIAALDGASVDGRRIKVNEAQPKPDRNRGGYGGGRDRY